MAEQNWYARLISEDRTEEELKSSIYVIYTERLFKIRQRKTYISREIKCGLYHFFSCSFILSVNPTLLQGAGFNADNVAVATALAAGFSCIFSGLLSNLPIVLSPTTATSLYFSLFIQNRNLSIPQGNLAVLFLGIIFFICGQREIARFISNSIPFVIKVGICLGVGLLIALEALTEIHLVQKGDRTVLGIGEFNSEIVIAMFAFVVIGVALHYRLRGSFLIGLLFGSLCYWVLVLIQQHGHVHIASSNIVVEGKEVDFSLTETLRSIRGLSGNEAFSVWRLTFDLLTIGIILLNGLSHSLAEMASLKRDNNSLPRGKWLYVACGFGTAFSAALGGGPIMISPESTPGIKSGARTGLSTVVCGLLFLLSTPLCPLFASVPASGTSPVLLMIGMMLFENAGKVNWGNVKESLPVFLMSIFIPFTYSILNGVIVGVGMFCVLYLVTESDDDLDSLDSEKSPYSPSLLMHGLRSYLGECCSHVCPCLCCSAWSCCVCMANGDDDSDEETIHFGDEYEDGEGGSENYVRAILADEDNDDDEANHLGMSRSKSRSNSGRSQYRPSYTPLNPDHSLILHEEEPSQKTQNLYSFAFDVDGSALSSSHLASISSGLGEEGKNTVTFDYSKRRKVSEPGTLGGSGKMEQKARQKRVQKKRRNEGSGPPSRDINGGVGSLFFLGRRRGERPDWILEERGL